MAKVPCAVELVEVENENGRMQKATRVTCGDCGETAEAFGQSDASKKRALCLLKENCPMQRSNYYVDEDEQ